MKREYVLYDFKTDQFEVIDVKLKPLKPKSGQFIKFDFIHKKTKKTVITLGPFLYLGVL